MSQWQQNGIETSVWEFGRNYRKMPSAMSEYIYIYKSTGNGENNNYKSHLRLSLICRIITIFPFTKILCV